MIKNERQYRITKAQVAKFEKWFKKYMSILLKRYRDTGVQRVVLINTATRPEQIDAALEEMGNTLVQPARQL